MSDAKTMPKVEKSEAEWRKELTPMQYAVLREKATERPFTGEYEHENRPGTFVSSETIFATYQNAGVRVFDIANQYRPEEIGYFVPPQPTKWAEPLRGRAKVRHTADIFVAQDGLIYVTDYDAGLYILQWKGN